MIAARECDDARATRVGACDLDGVLHRFRAGRDQKRLLGKVAGGERVQFFRQRDIGLVRHDLEGRMRVEVFLGLGSGDDRRVAMAGVQDGDAARKINEGTFLFDFFGAEVFAAGAFARLCAAGVFLVIWISKDGSEMMKILIHR